MYSVLQDLPLFKGMGDAQVSSFLARTHIEFLKIPAGKSIVENGDPVEHITFLLSGKCSVEFTNVDGSFRMSYMRGPGMAIGVVNMFGMDTRFTGTVTAVEECGVMRFDKEQLLRLLVEERLCLLNLLNLLSFSAQRPSLSLMKWEKCSVRSLLAFWLKTFVPPQTNDILVKTSPETLSRMINLTPLEVKRELKQMEEENLIHVSPSRVLIRSCRQLLEGKL